jgi:RNA polymerase sigma-70 factor, ECF subfamily
VLGYPVDHRLEQKKQPDDGCPDASNKVGARMKAVGDEDLVVRVAGGDEQALSELYDRYCRPVYATGIRLLGDAFLAEELVQDAFINVWRRAETFNPGLASFSTWLHKITRNRAVDLARRRHARPLSVGEDPLQIIPGGPEPEDKVNSWDVARSLSRIPNKHREVLELAYFEGLTQREISQRINVPLGTIKSRTTAALKNLRQIMTSPLSKESRGD